MKKIFLRALCAVFSLIMIFSLSSCVKDPPYAAELLFEALNRAELPSAYKIYHSEAFDGRDNFLSERDSLRIYGDSDMPLYSESFAVAMTLDDSAWEVHIFIAHSLGDAGFIENALEKRLSKLQSREIYIYDIENYEKCIAGGKVFRDGRVVCLCVCPDSKNVLAKVKECL